MEQARQRHAVRGVIAATVATFVALLSHVLAGGEIPGWLGILTPWVLSLPVCVGLARWRLSLGRLAVSVAVSQLFFHTLFVLGASGGSGAVVSVPTGHTGHGLELVVASTAAVPAYDSAVMWLWHVIAAVATIAAVHRGERAVRRIGQVAARAAAWVAARILPGSLTPVTVSAARPRAAAFSTAPLAPHFELSPLLRRGPPALAR